MEVAKGIPESKFYAGLYICVEYRMCLVKFDIHRCNNMFDFGKGIAKRKRKMVEDVLNDTNQTIR